MKLVSLYESINDKGILKALFVIGITASGKSLLSKPLNFFARHLDIDYPQEFYSIKNDIDLGINGDSTIKRNLMKRSIEITKAQLKSYTNNMLPIVYNTTGVNLHLIKSKIECLRALGYDVGIIHINADLNNVLKRAKARRYGNNKHRHVPETFIQDSYKILQLNANEYKAMVASDLNSTKHIIDFYKVVQNNGYMGDETITNVYKLAMDFFNSPVKNPVGKSIINKIRNDNLKSLSDVFNKSELDSIYTLWK